MSHRPSRLPGLARRGIRSYATFAAATCGALLVVAAHPPAEAQTGAPISQGLAARSQRGASPAHRAAAPPQESARGSQEDAPGLVYPVDLVIDDGLLVVADFKAHGLLRVGLDGNVEPLLLGEGLPRTPLYGTRAVVGAPDGNGWLVADPGTFGLYRVDSGGSLSTITTELDIPQGLAVYDDTSVLVSDLRSGIGAVMRVTLDGIVTVFAELGSPKGIAADGEDGFVVVSHGERALFSLSRDGRIGTIASGPPFDFPHDVALLPDGDFAVTDGYAQAIFRVGRGGDVSEIASGSPLVNPQGIAVGDDGHLWVVDPQAGAVFEVSIEGEVTRRASVTAGDAGPARQR